MRSSPAITMAIVLLCAAGCRQSEPPPPEAPAEEPSTTVAADPWRTLEPGGETACSDGSAYSFHVKEGSAEQLFVFLNGGGACWNAQTCDTAAGEETFVARADVPHNDPRSHGGVFNLDHPDNPFADWTMVFVSYCTGDVHLGTAERAYETEAGRVFNIRHNGVANVSSALAWAKGHTDPSRVVIAGASAGALASPVYAREAAKLFPQADILHFAGGAGGYQSEHASRIFAQWGVAAAPETPVANPLYTMEDELAARIRFSFYDTTHDSAQVRFRNLTGDTGPLADAIRSTYSQLGEQISPMTHYLAGGDSHTILRFDAFYDRNVGGEAFSTWFGQLLEGGNPVAVDCASTPAGCEGV